MSTIVLVPLYAPALLAKQVTALDLVSGGCFHLGVGVGGEFAPEFEACGVSVKERGARTDEALDVLTRLWTEEEVHFEGRFTRLPGVSLDPQPVRKPHPPIWVAGRREAAMKRCARFGDGWLPYMYTPEMLAETVECDLRDVILRSVEDRRLAQPSSPTRPARHPSVRSSDPSSTEAVTAWKSVTPRSRRATVWNPIRICPLPLYGSPRDLIPSELQTEESIRRSCARSRASATSTTRPRWRCTSPTLPSTRATSAPSWSPRARASVSRGTSASYRWAIGRATSWSSPATDARGYQASRRSSSRARGRSDGRNFVARSEFQGASLVCPRFLIRPRRT